MGGPSILDLIFAADAAPAGGDEQKDVLRHPASLCLSAGAGSGKTRTLVGKYIQLLAVEGRNPSDILAITFTEKAATEMRLRIREALKELIRMETDPERCAELEEKLGSIGAGWISTIHAFGARVLREHPAEAEIDPSFTPLTAQDAEEVWSAAAMAAILEWVEQDPNVADMALRLGLSGGTGRNLVSILMSIRKQIESTGLSVDDLQIPDPAPAAARLDTAPLRNALDPLISRDDPGATLGKKAPAWRDLCDALASTAAGADHILRALVKAGWDDKALRLKPGGTLKKPEGELFSSVEIHSRLLAAAAADVCQSRIGWTLKRLAASMWRRAESEKARRRALDFSDLELKTLKLFETRPEVVSAYQSRFSHILVDEYQDVNAVQARIVRRLAGDRPRSLFAVGDPKQSIYLFRGADITQFQSLWAEMESRGAAFELKRNFRSHPRLVSAVNEFFDGRVFGGNPPVRMVPGDPARDKGGQPRIQWLNIPVSDETAPRRREAEAAQIAAHIARLIGMPAGEGVTDGQLSFADVALLFRATTSLFIYEEAFRRAHIPYELVKSGTAFRSQEVLDVLNAMTVIGDPSDRIAWLGFLRSPLAGISDDGVFQFSRAGDIREFVMGDDAVPAGLSEADRGAAEAARDLYAKAAEQRKLRTPLSLMDWLIAESGYSALLSGMPMPATRLRYVETLRSVAAQYAGRRPDPLTAFLNAAWRMVKRNDRESGADSPDSDTVKLMTIHQSKGLEFPVVILPDLLRPERSTAPDIMISSQGELSARVKIPGAALSFPTERWTIDRKAADEAAVEEQKRLLYVAMTRARELLVLPGPDQEVKGGSVWEMLYVFLREDRKHVETVTPEAVDAAEIPQARPIAKRLQKIRMTAATVKHVVPAIRTVIPSSLKPARPAITPRRRKRRSQVESGTAFAVQIGTIAHDVLYHMDLSASADDQERAAETYLDARLGWAAIPAKPAAQLRQDIARFLRGPLAERMRAEKRGVRREYPFSMPAGRARGSESIVRGKVDLMIVSAGGVEIYDYKYQKPLDQFGDYTGQLMAYALAACRAFELDRATVGLQFLMGDQRLISREVSAAEAETAVKSLLA